MILKMDITYNYLNEISVLLKQGAEGVIRARAFMDDVNAITLRDHYYLLSSNIEISCKK